MTWMNSLGGCVNKMSCHFFFFSWSYAFCILGKPYSWVDTILSFSLFARWRYTSVLIYAQLASAPVFWVTTEIRNPETTEVGLLGYLSHVVSGSYFCWIYLWGHVSFKESFYLFISHWGINHSLLPILLQKCIVWGD